MFHDKIIRETARKAQAINADARFFSADDSVEGSGSGAELAPDDLGCSGTRISSTTSMTRGVCVVVAVIFGSLVVSNVAEAVEEDASEMAMVAVSITANKSGISKKNLSKTSEICKRKQKRAESFSPILLQNISAKND